MFTARPQSWLKRLSQALRNGYRRRHKSPTARPILLTLEGLEDRLVPTSGVATPMYVLGPVQAYSPNSIQPDSTSYQEGGAFTPLGIQTAYGVTSLPSGDTGAGQTIAVIDAYDDPAFLNSTDPNFARSDLAHFDAAFGLSNPMFVKVSQTGSTTALPGTDPAGQGNPTGNWEIEEALDVEYAHTMAPAAKIMLVECSSDSTSDLFAGADWAATPVAQGGGGATVVSMSFGVDGGFSGETAYDSTFSPTTYPGVTFIASAGDAGPVAPSHGTTGQADYPADSPDVVAVGGTNLQANPTTGAYISESVWNELSVGAGATGGGVSNFESQPSYQATAAAGISTTQRVAPDVAFDADPYSGVFLYDSYNGSLGGTAGEYDGISDTYAIGGTSVSSPLMAGVVAVADQIRVADGMTSLTGATQTLPTLYSIYTSSRYSQDFHDVTSGSVGGYSAGTGYDALSGLGTPIVSNLAPDLATGILATPSTQTSVGGLPNPVVFGHSVTFTATVTNTTTSTTPTGSVQFFDNGVLLGDGSALTGSGASAISTYTTMALPSGPQSITAVFTGTGAFPNSTSSVYTEDVDAVTTTGVASSLNPSTPGQTVTFTATVTNSSGTASPTGSVEFFNGTTDLGPGTALTVGGAAVTSTFTTSTLPAGEDDIIAKYTASGDFVTSQGSISQTVNAITTTGVSSSLNPSVFGNSVTFTATVTNSSGTASPTGSVEFFNGTTDLGPGTALTVGGAAVLSTFTTSTLPAGEDYVIAVYTPSGDFVTSQGSISQTVNAITTTGVSSSLNPSVFGNSVTFTAAITNTSGTAVPTGSVEFFDGDTDLGAGTVPSGVAGSGLATSTFSTTALPSGPQTIKAVYTPTGTFVGSNGSTIEDVQAVTTTGVSSSLNPSVFGNSVTFTATVTNSSGTASPTGSVEFFNGTTDLGPGTALTVGGAAVTSTFTTSTLPAGVDDVIAVYTPSGDFVTSQGSISQTVNAITTTGVSSSLNPSVFGDSVTFTATVTDASATTTPTGSVEFFNGNVDLGPGSALSGTTGSAASTFTTMSLPAGANSINAVYTETGDFVGSSGDVTQHVQAVTRTTIASSTNPSISGNSTTFTATIVNNNSSATPTGTVEFFNGTTDLGAGSDLSGTGASAASTFPISTLPVGSDTIKAVYTPTGDFVGGSGTLTQVVTATVFPTPPAAIVSAVLKANGELDLFNQHSGAVTVISPASTIASITTALNATGQTVVFAVVADADAQGNLHTLWEYNPANLAVPWSEISTGLFTQISGASTASSVPVVYGVVAGGSLWEQNPANGTGLNVGWTELSSGSFQSISPVSTSAGVVMYGVVAGGSLWEQNPANGTGLNVGWTELSSGSFQSISAGINGAGQTVVYGLVAGGSLYEQNPANGTGLNVGWTELSGGPLVSGNGTAPSSFLSVASGGADTAFAIASDHTLWQHKNAGWQEISSGVLFAQISATESATGADLVFAALSDGEFWDYNSALLPANPWSQVLQNGFPLAGAALSSTPG